MDVQLQGIGKRYSKDWVLRNLDLHIAAGEHVAILGNNGSGKSTLLKIISGYLTPSKGTLNYNLSDEPIEIDKIFSHIGYVAPYIDVYKKLTFSELVDFHFSLRDLKEGSSKEIVLNELPLPTGESLQSFSSGMLQRVKLLLSFHTKAQLLLFDEPTMNLDETGSKWFQNQLQNLGPETSVVIASNLPGSETQSCTRSFTILQGKLSLAD